MQWIKRSGNLNAEQDGIEAEVSGSGYLWRLLIVQDGATVIDRYYHPTNSREDRRTPDDAKRDAEKFVFDAQKVPA